MNMISSNNVNYDDVLAIEEAFNTHGFSVETPEPVGMGNARVDVVCPLNKDGDLKVVVMVWVSSGDSDMLKFRVVLYNSKKRNEFEKNEDLWNSLIEIAADLNQNAAAYGALSLNNMSGIVIDYNLTMFKGIPAHTIVKTVEEVARGARYAYRRIRIKLNKNGYE